MITAGDLAPIARSPLQRHGVGVLADAGINVNIIKWATSLAIAIAIGIGIDFFYSAAIYFALTLNIAS